MALLGEHPDLEVLGSVGTVAEATEFVKRESPDVVLMDSRLPDGSGAEATAIIRAHEPAPAVVFLTGDESDDALVSAIDAGACGYLLKSGSGEEIIAAVLEAAQGDVQITTAGRASSRLNLMAELREGLQNQQLVLQYQPVVRLSTGEILRFEALARWPHPERGVLQPNDFIPFAEKTRLIEPLTRWALETALQQCWLWRHAGHEIGVSVNVSLRDLVGPELLKKLGELLVSTRAEPDWLALEIAESVIMAEPERIKSTLGNLKRLGVRLAIDDFGTGYSSLAYLHLLPVDELKIDRTFVTPSARAASQAAIVRAVIELGASLRLETVAEGVEDARTRDLVAALGCDAAQGFYVAGPMDPNAVLPWLARWKASRTESAAAGSGP